MTISELRDKRANLWKSMTAFLDTRTGSDGVLSAEDDASYAKMEKDFDSLTNEIKRMERKEALEAEMNKPVGTPITEKPMKTSDDEEKTGRASKVYNKSFWNAMRQKNIRPEIANALQEGTDSEGGYLVPDEFEHTLIEALESENIFRTLAHVIQTASGDRKIPVVASKGTASWVDEEGAITESDDAFNQVSIGAYKLGTLIKVSNELLNDSVFNLEQYISKEFARRIGNKEEDAFFNGDGSGKPVGIFHSTGGAQVGVTAASTSAITADEVIDLFYCSAARPSIESQTKEDTIEPGTEKLSITADPRGDGLVKARTGNTTDVMLERERRMRALGRTDRIKPAAIRTAPVHFRFGEVKAYHDDPAAQAEYLYTLIESEER